MFVASSEIDVVRDLIAFENEFGTGASLEKFNETLNIIRRRHLDTVPLMAQAVIKLNHKKRNLSDGVNETIQYFLDRLYTNRLVFSLPFSSPPFVLLFSKNINTHANLTLQCTARQEQDADRHGGHYRPKL